MFSFKITGWEMVRPQEGIGLRPNRLLSHWELDQGCDEGLQVQDARRLRPFPHQLRHLGSRNLGMYNKFARLKKSFQYSHSLLMTPSTSDASDLRFVSMCTEFRWHFCFTPTMYFNGHCLSQRQSIILVINFKVQTIRSKMPPIQSLFYSLFLKSIYSLK